MSVGEFNGFIDLLVGITLLAAGVLCLFRKDIVWRFYSWNMRSKGVKNIEQTPEWNLRFTVIGVIASAVGLISVLYVFLV